MPCYFPLKGYRSRSVNKTTGKRSLVFSPSAGYSDLPVTVPCGRCIGCRLERSRQWAMRCVHEASLYSSNSFLTLTFNDSCLPVNGSICVRDVQLFMKRLRKKVSYSLPIFGSRKVRFFACGEYGSRLSRPHYHVLLFGYDFPDKVFEKMAGSSRLYSSKILSKLWPFGFALIGDVTFESAAYVARYIVKKRMGEDATEHYAEVDHETGEVRKEKSPEFIVMSRRPGIGAGWFDRYGEEVYRSGGAGTVVFRGRVCAAPKFYDARLAVRDEARALLAKAGRRLLAKGREADGTVERLIVREEVTRARNSSLKRRFEDGA